jgi:hypothetical protein
MPKFIVQVFGEVPDCITVEAKDKDAAEEQAWEEVVDLLNFEAELDESQVCRFCGCPMKPKGVKKRPDEYDHAQGCPYSRRKRRKA